jgi:cytoskeleton protein RodZ
MTEKNDDIEITHSELTIGNSLKSAREAKNISISEVASHLMLTKDTITALEKEQWDALHGRAYARGYLLSYVRFLGIPEQETLAAFNISYGAPETFATKKISQKRSFPIMPIIFLVIVVLMTAFAYEHWRNTAPVDTDETNGEELTQQQNDTIPLIDN